MKTTKLNLTYTKETEKALLTVEFGWIPKSAAPLAVSGQIHEVATWLVNKNPEMKAMSEKQAEESKALFSNVDWKNEKRTWHNLTLQNQIK